jgi:16S rRNA A1518/A1519 N6-dimethyltransferase RsmA/KsgA/DIM1 with predicted DNA glycosylase/AP lyase activity
MLTYADIRRAVLVLQQEAVNRVMADQSQALSLLLSLLALLVQEYKY